jgi:hypothetical protein
MTINRQLPSILWRMQVAESLKGLIRVLRKARQYGVKGVRLVALCRKPSFRSMAHAGCRVFTGSGEGFALSETVECEGSLRLVALCRKLLLQSYGACRSQSV